MNIADGRNLLVGGTDWYNEPSVPERAEGDPANGGIVELEGLPTARTFHYRTDRWDATTSMKSAAGTRPRPRCPTGATPCTAVWPS